MWRKQQPSQHKICRQNIRHEKFIWEHHVWCHVKIPEVATLVSVIPNFWCSLEVAATDLHLCFVIKGNVWWKLIFLPMVTIVVLHHKHMKLFKPFTHVIAWSARKGFNQSYGAPFVKILYLTDLAQKLLSLCIFSYLCAEIAISTSI